MIKWLRKKVEEPALKTLIGIVGIIVSGVLSGAFVTEITKNGVLEWNTFLRAKAFYGLLFLAVCMYFYFKFLYVIESAISNFKDDGYAQAYMRKECLPELAEKSREFIRAGKDTKEIKNIIKDLNL